MLFFNEGYDMSIEKKWRAYDFTKMSHDRLIFGNCFLDGFGQIVLVFLTCACFFNAHLTCDKQ